MARAADLDTYVRLTKLNLDDISMEVTNMEARVMEMLKKIESKEQRLAATRRQTEGELTRVRETQQKTREMIIERDRLREILVNVKPPADE